MAARLRAQLRIRAAGGGRRERVRAAQQRTHRHLCVGAGGDVPEPVSAGEVAQREDVHALDARVTGAVLAQQVGEGASRAEFVVDQHQYVRGLLLLPGPRIERGVQAQVGCMAVALLERQCVGVHPVAGGMDIQRRRIVQALECLEGAVAQPGRGFGHADEHERVARPDLDRARQGIVRGAHPSRRDWHVLAQHVTDEQETALGVVAGGKTDVAVDVLARRLRAEGERQLAGRQLRLAHDRRRWAASGHAHDRTAARWYSPTRRP